MAGVGKSRLHQAFSEIYGISPGTYLYRLRLTSIREKLLSEEAPPRSVKDVAIQHGFLSSGQLARAYRDMFGELPSQTLRARKK
jgi:transcriptional regulator GlxA family with amidase domain